MTFEIIVKERNKMNMRNSRTEFAWTPPVTQFSLMLFRFELKKTNKPVNIVICLLLLKEKNSVSLT